MIGNPLDDGKGNYLTNIMSGDDGSGNFLLIPDGTTIYAWNTNTGSYRSDAPSFVGGAGGGWGDPSQFFPGNGFWIQSGSADGSGPTFNITFVGNVMQGSMSTLLGTGITLAASQIPAALPVGFKGDLNSAGPNDPTTPTLQIPTFDGDTVYLYTNTATTSGYSSDAPSYAFGTGWQSSVFNANGPIIQPGQGFWYYRTPEDADAAGNPATSTSNGGQSWAYTFNVQ